MKKLGFGVVFIFLMFFYVKTLLPTVAFWDTAEFQTIPYTLDIGHPPGFPTYVLSGKLFLTISLFGNVAFRMNLFSAITMALAMGFLMLIIQKLTDNLLVGIFGSLILGFSRSIWGLATHADAHSLNLFFNSLIIYLIVVILKDKKSKLTPVAFFVFGLALGNHLLSIFLGPPLLLALKKDIKILFCCLILFALGLSVYVFLPIKAASTHQLIAGYDVTTMDGFLRHVLGKDFSGMMTNWTTGNFVTTIQFYLKSLEVYLPRITWGIAVMGMILAFWKNFRISLIFMMIFIGTLYFSLRYQNAALDRYFLPSFMIITIWIAFLISRIKNAYILVVIFSILIWKEISINYALVDQSKNYQAERYARDILNSVEDNGVILTWWSYYTPLWYMTKVEGVKSGVKLYCTGQNEWEKIALENINDRPVYLIGRIELRDPRLTLVQKGNLAQVVYRE